MAAAARDYLAIPVSEIAMERSFSIGRDFRFIRGPQAVDEWRHNKASDIT
jgi:hypothetical protein